MSNFLPLSSCASYVTEKVKSSDLSLEEYVTTDNLLQNKLGLTLAESLPAQAGNVTRFKKGDVLVANIRPYLNKIWYADRDGGCSADVLAFRAKGGINSKFLYYSLFRDDFFDHVMRGSKGTKMPRGDKNQIMRFFVPNFSDFEQVKIAEILSVLDDKIGLNNCINTTLEAMAKTLYDYWFVQFDFPDANGKPYKTYGGKMVYNPTLKREIPEGWVPSNILSVANLLGGGTPTKTKSEYWNGSIPFFTPTDSDNNIYSLTTEDYITDAGLKNSSTRLFEKNTVFITARGSVGRLALNGVPMAMNQSCYALRAKEGVSYSFVFFLTKELIHHLQVKASGSVFGSIVSNDIEYTNLTLPSDCSLIERFALKAEPAFEKIELLTKENQQLSCLRNWLLPMLMNGQVAVK